MWTLKFSAEQERYLEAKGAAVLSERVRPENTWAWQAYIMLSGSRPLSEMGSGAIPISEIAAYCDLTGVNDRSQRMLLTHLVQAMDRAEREHHGKT